MPTAGTLRHQVTIEQSTVTPDGLGGGARSYTTFLGPIWAGLYIYRGGERNADGSIRAQYAVRWTIRYQPGVTEQMRVNWNGAYYPIRAVTMQEGITAWLYLDCLEGE